MRQRTEEEIAGILHIFATEGGTAAADKAGVNLRTVQRWAKARGVKGRRVGRPPVHGRSRYERLGCRCDECANAKRESMLATKADLRRRQDEAPHGTETAYRNWGCRCGPCKAAGSETNRKARLRRKAGLTRK